MPFPTIYRVHLKCREDESNKIVFEGTLKQMVHKFGNKQNQPLKPYLEGSKIYNYTFSICINYRWKTIADPRPEG